MRSGQRGASAIIVAIVLAMLCAFAAMSIEVGHIMSVRGELQNGADAAALAGARRLNGTNVDFALEGARAEAQNYARAHPTDVYDVEPFTIQLGNWADASTPCASVNGVQIGTPAADSRKFCWIQGTTAADAQNINAVRVVTNRQGTPGGTGGGAVAHPLGGFLGRSQSDVAAEAIAVTGSPCNERCPELPFAIKQSCVKDNGIVECGGQPVLFYVGLAASGIDSAGLTIFKQAACNDSTGSDTKYNGSSGWGTGDVCDILGDQCAFHPVVGQCISIKNGDNITGQCPSIGDKICNALRDKVGQVAQVPLVEYSAGENCSGGFSDFNYTQSAKVVGIGSVRIVGGQCLTGNDKGVVALPGYEAAVSRCQFANGSCFVLEFLCNQRDDDATTVGCGWTGTGPLRPVLVR